MIFLYLLSDPVPPTPAPLLPNLPFGTPTWVYLAIAFIPVISLLAGGAVYMMKRYADGKILELKDRIAKAKRASDELEAIKQKQEATTILIVDDDVNDQLLMGRTFKLIGMENKITYRDSPNAALGYLHQNFTTTLFVLVDIKMVSNGYRLLETMKLDDDLKKIPVILISGSASDIQEDVFKKGAIGFLTKPLQIYELLSFLNYQGFSITIER